MPSHFFGTFPEIDNYNQRTRTELIRCIEKISLNLSLSQFVLRGMFNVRKRNRISKITMYYIKFALFKTPRRTLIIIKVPD